MSDERDANQRIRDLEEQVAMLQETVQYLVVCKQRDPRFAYFDWLVEHGVVGERQVHFNVVLTTLSLRLDGTVSLPPRSLPGVADELLYKDGPPTHDEVATVLMQVLGMENRDAIEELFRAMMAQGVHQELVRLWQREGHRPAPNSHSR